MRRYPPYDPPEYVDWVPDPALVEAYAGRLRDDAERWTVIESLREAELLSLYEGLLRNRLHDLMLKRWVRRGILSKAWLGTGEEAVTIGSVHALRRTGDRPDVVAPMIRNAGACHAMGMSIADMLRGYLATADSPNGGRDLHIGELDRGVLSPISHVGQMVPVVTGVALGFLRRSEPRVALTWIGDGASKTGVVHEGLNLAAVLRLPAIFVLQNNQVALGTRLEQHHIGDFLRWHGTYGLPTARVDGNNVLDVMAATRLAADRARAGDGPTLLVAETFRMAGHATHDEAEARKLFPEALFREWGQRDPVGLFEAYLESTGIGRDALEAVEAAVTAEVEHAAEGALESRDKAMPTPDAAEWPGISAGTRQPGLAARLGTD